VCLAPLIISLSRYSLGFRPVFSGVRENHVSFVKTPHTNTTRFILQVRPVRPADVAGLSLPLACSLPCPASICTHPPFCCASDTLPPSLLLSSSYTPPPPSRRFPCAHDPLASKPLVDTCKCKCVDECRVNCAWKHVHMVLKRVCEDGGMLAHSLENECVVETHRTTESIPCKSVM